MRVATQRSPAVMQSELLDFHNRVSCFKKPAGCLVSQVMKVQIVYPEHSARSSKSSTYRLGFKWEYSILIVILSMYNFPCFI